MTPAAERTVAEHAIHWNAFGRTIDRWRAAGCPLHDDLLAAQWIVKKDRAPAASKKKARAIIAAARKGGNPAAELPGPAQAGSNAETDWERFQKLAKAKDPKKAMEEIALARDFASMKFQDAAQAGDEGLMKFYSDLLAKMESTLHDAQLRAKKLGIDAGDLYGGEQIDRIFRAIAYWQLRCIDESLPAMCERVAGASGGALTRQDVKRLVEPSLLASRLLVPLTRATKVNAGVGIPARFVEAMKAGVASVLEDGAAEFEKLYSDAPPAP